MPRCAENQEDGRTSENWMPSEHVGFPEVVRIIEHRLELVDGRAEPSGQVVAHLIGAESLGRMRQVLNRMSTTNQLRPSPTATAPRVRHRGVRSCAGVTPRWAGACARPGNFAV